MPDRAFLDDRAASFFSFRLLLLLLLSFAAPESTITMLVEYCIDERNRFRFVRSSVVDLATATDGSS